MTEALRAIDANVVLRYLLKDNLEQWERATRLIDSGEPLSVTAVVLAEVGWSLAGPRRRIDRREVARQLVAFVSRENIVAVGFDKAEALASLITCAGQGGTADLGDALIAACARSFGVSEIYSFDRRFARAGLIPVTPA